MRNAGIFLALCLLGSMTRAATLHVPGEYATIQAAIDAASPGDTVLVAWGRYVENIDFKGKAISLRSESGPDVTLIDGNQIRSVVTCQGGETPNTVLDGFTLTNGTGFSGYSGMFNLNSSPTITHCVFIENDFGMVNEESNATVVHCDFIGNVACGIDNKKSHPTVIYCTFHDNGCGMNNTDSGPAVDYCDFHQTARGINSDDSHLKVSHCTFTGNGFCGMEAWGGTLTMDYCTFLNNTEPDGYGGGIDFVGSSATITHCIFAGNDAFWGGGISGVGGEKVAHCTFFNNSAQQGGGILGCGKVINCILWYNFPDQVAECGSVTYCCVMGGAEGAGNISDNPLLASPGNKDFHLTYPSPCRDAGKNGAVPDLWDFEGDPRVPDGQVDMGADEFYRHCYVLGKKKPGGKIDLKLVGLPGTTPLGMIFGSGVLEAPVYTPHGPYYLEAPWVTLPLFPFQIPAGGILTISGKIPPDPAAPYDLPMQALIGLKPDSLSNLEVLEVR